jgi:hypothetical protein
VKVGIAILSIKNVSLVTNLFSYTKFNVIRHRRFAQLRHPFAHGRQRAVPFRAGAARTPPDRAQDVAAGPKIGAPAQPEAAPAL